MLSYEIQCWPISFQCNFLGKRREAGFYINIHPFFVSLVAEKYRQGGVLQHVPCGAAEDIFLKPHMTKSTHY